MPETLSHVIPVTTFASTCPSVEDVTAFLACYGFSLKWSMNARVYRSGWLRSSTDPAHYHYQDHQNTEVVYVAGSEVSLSGERFPPHASRWWVYPGHDPSHTSCIRDALSTRWGIIWLPDQG